jgi:hypothetical protein
MQRILAGKWLKILSVKELASLLLGGRGKTHLIRALNINAQGMQVLAD